MKKIWFVSALVFLVFLAACKPRVQAVPLDATPRLAILSAFDAEAQKLLTEIQDRQAIILHGRTFTTGRLAGQNVVLAVSGVSMVNAAVTAQTTIDYFEVTGIVFSGIAGGVNPDLHIGDVTVPARWGQYQEQRFVRQTGDGWAVPSGAPFGNYDMMVPMPVEVTPPDGRPDTVIEKFWFDVDGQMLEAAEAAAARVTLDDCPAVGGCLTEAPRVVTGGNGVSGPTFVDNAEYREWVWQTFQADALDMESAAVAQVAYSNAKPFIAFRSLSDLAGGGPGANEIALFFQLAADNSAAVVTAFLEEMGQ